MILCFMIILGILLIIEHKIYNTYLTPFFVIGVVYFFSVPMVNTIGVLAGYNAISDFSIFLFLVFLITFFSGGILFKIIAYTNKINFVETQGSLYMKKYNKIIFLIFIIALAGYFISFLNAVRQYGILETKGHSEGIGGHLGLICVSISPYVFLYALKYKNKLIYFFLFCFYILMLMFGGKYPVVITFISSVILYLLNYPDKSKSILKIIGCISIIMCLSFVCLYGVIPYLVNGITAIGENTFWGFIGWPLSHMLSYYIGAYVTPNTYFLLPEHDGLYEGMRVLLNPLIRIYEAILGTGDYPDVIMSYWAPISNDAILSNYSNVGGIFSETVFRVGYGLGIIYIFALSVLLNMIFSFKSKKYFHLITSFIITITSICFFNNFFTLLSIFEILVYAFMIDAGIIIANKAYN